MELLYSTYYTSTSTGKVLLALYGGSATIGTSTVLQLYAWVSSQYQLFSMDFSVGSSRSAPTAVPRSVVPIAPSTPNCVFGLLQYSYTCTALRTGLL